jgi:hypothetical protein
VAWRAEVASPVWHARLALENAEGLATIAEEIGAEVIRGEVRYPSKSGDIEVAGADIGEYLEELKKQGFVVIVVPPGPVGEHPVICGLCLSWYDGEQCATCKAERQAGKTVIDESLRQHGEEKDRLVKDVEEWLEERD